VLGIIKRPFAVGNEQHTLAAHRPTGSISMASATPRPISQTLARQVADANARRQAAALRPFAADQRISA
jgi:hypothetical protein